MSKGTQAIFGTIPRFKKAPPALQSRGCHPRLRCARSGLQHYNGSRGPLRCRMDGGSIRTIGGEVRAEPAEQE
jgi:hypothetical protein